MNKKGFRVFISSIAVLTLLIGVLAGCGSKSTDSTVGTTAASEATTLAATESTKAEGSVDPIYDTSEPIRFTFYWSYKWKNVQKKFEETAIGQEIQKRMNAYIDVQSPGGDEATKLNLMIASNSLPDVIMMDRNEQYKKLIDLGMLVELDPYFEKYPGYRTHVDPGTLNYAKVNGHIYSFLNWNTTPRSPSGNGGWMVNSKVYSDLGSPKLDTLDDLFKFLSDAKAKGIKVNGKDIIPLQLDPGNYWRGLYELYFSFGGIGTVTTEDMCYVDGDKLKFLFQDPKWQDAMVYTNKLWNAGLINKDVFVETSQQKDDKRDTGRIAVYTGPDCVNELRDGTNTWKKVDPTGSYQMIEPPAGGGFDQSKIACAMYKTLGWNSICITKNAKNPERIYQVIDWIASPEGQLLTFHGPKGILWDELDENGYPIYKKTRSEMPQDEALSVGFEEYTNLCGMSEWVDKSKAAANAKLPPEKQDIVITNQANITWKHSGNATEFEGIFTDANTPEGVAFLSVQAMVRKMIPQIVMAKDEGECRKLLQEAIDQAYKLKFDTVEAFKTKLWLENKEKLSAN